MFKYKRLCVFQIQLRQNKISAIKGNSFAGLFTVGSIQFQSNYIARIEPNAFDGSENLGSLALSYNHIKEAMESEQCLQNEAQRFMFTENTLKCKWVPEKIARIFVLSNRNYRRDSRFPKQKNELT